MITRLLEPSENRSFFLFGARGTGKSTFLHQQFLKDQKCLWIDLLKPSMEDRLSRNPEELLQIIESSPARQTPWVVIDEIQKTPALLDVLHSTWGATKHRFVLTGSSARKLKRGAANLLAGRASVYHLFPFTHQEAGRKFDLGNALNWGSLPGLLGLSAADRSEFLDAYVHTYLKEEIIAEQIIRKTRPFRAFLEVAGQCSGTILNYSKIARDIGSDPVSTQSYFDILEDTLLGFYLHPYHASIRKRQMKHPKFYLFDLGVKRALERTLDVPITPQTSYFGVHFEHFVIQELHRLASYRRLKWSFSYLRTKDDLEIDLIIERPGLPTALIEIKSATHLADQDLRSLERVAQDFKKAEVFCFSQDPVSRKSGRVCFLHWKKGIQELGL